MINDFINFLFHHFFLFLSLIVLIIIIFIIIICKFVQWYNGNLEILKGQKKILKKLEDLENYIINKNFNKIDNIISESDVIKNIDEIIKNIFIDCKNIAIYINKYDIYNQNIVNYFKAKGFKIFLFEIELKDIKSYNSISLIDEKIELVLVSYLKVNDYVDKQKKIIKSSISRKKFRGDVKYIWFENDFKNVEDFIKILNSVDINFIKKRNFYKEYIDKILKNS